jgi:tetratricopeptide (TPR) repeat protein
MTSKTLQVAIGGALLLGLWTAEAHAWGPKAQQLITNTAIQRVHEKVPNAFKNEQQNFQGDVVRGATENATELSPALGITDRSNAIEAIGNQIALLREARRIAGVGSYFAYRMGALSAAISDLMLPYALDTSSRTARLRETIQEDIEQHARHYTFLPEGRLQVVNHLDRYLQGYRPFAQDSLRIIEADYRSGKGYNGYMRQAGPAFFGDAIQATADIWYTIMAPPGAVTTAKPSPATLSNYFVDEIQYLLEVKNNTVEAANKYTVLDKVNPNLPAIYERVGDLWHNAGARNGDRQLLERAVREWERALELPRADRRRLSQKLAAHYMAIGRAQAEAAEKPGGYRLMGDALQAFERALEYDRNSREAEDLLRKAQTRKRELDEALETETRLIDSAEQVMKQAEESENTGNFGNAILLYNNALGIFGGVSDQFPELKESAEKRSEELDERIKTIKQRRLDEARDMITKGDEEMQANRFAEAIVLYESVPDIVSVITDEAATEHGKQRDEIIDEAQKKAAEAKNAKDKYDEQQRLLEQGGAPAGGARQ